MQAYTISSGYDSSHMLTVTKIDFFIEKLKNGIPFKYLKFNHGFFDNLITSSYLKSISNNFSDASFYDSQYLNRNKKWHNLVTKEDYSSFLKLAISNFYTNDNLTYLAVSDTNGFKVPQVSINNQTYVKIKSLLSSTIKPYVFHAGIFRWYGVNRTLFDLVNELNREEYNVIAVVPDANPNEIGMLSKTKEESYMTLFKNIEVIKVPHTNGISKINQLSENIRKNRSANKKNIILWECGSMISMAIDRVNDSSLTWIDLGRALDFISPFYIAEIPAIPKYTVLNKIKIT
jgi:hypothetical protein